MEGNDLLIDKRVETGGENFVGIALLSYNLSEHKEKEIIVRTWKRYHQIVDSIAKKSGWLPAAILDTYFYKRGLGYLKRSLREFFDLVTCTKKGKNLLLHITRKVIS